MNELIDNLQNILNQKNNYIIPNNIRENITVLNITGNLEEGINTSDATATASDILEGKTAYVNGVKLNGTMESLTDVIANQTNIINELEAELNDKAGLSFQVPNGMKFRSSTFDKTPDLDYSLVTNMSNMFRECLNLVKVSDIDTSKVTNMSYLFEQCQNLTSIPNFNTVNVTNMTGMFYGCYNLTNIPNFNTSNVTHVGSMLRQCRNLTSIPDMDTHKVTDLTYTFYECINLTTVPQLDTSNATNTSSMFSSCFNLINIPEYNTSNVRDMSQMFLRCNNLTNKSIQNIVNMCLNSNITASIYKNLNNKNSYSPLYSTKFNGSYYSDRLTELDAAGWKY